MDMLGIIPNELRHFLKSESLAYLAPLLPAKSS